MSWTLQLQLLKDISINVLSSSCRNVFKSSVHARSVGGVSIAWLSALPQSFPTHFHFQPYGSFGAVSVISIVAKERLAIKPSVSWVLTAQKHPFELGLSNSSSGHWWAQTKARDTEE